MADDPDYSFDILEARYAIEASTAWHAAMRATPGDKEKIQLCFEATLSEDPDIASQADVRFHLAIAEASHNIVLLQTMRGFFDVLQSSVKHSRQRMYLVPPVFSQLTEQHQAVIDAIFAGDADGARKAMMAHLSFVHTTMKRFDEDQARHARITAPQRNAFCRRSCSTIWMVVHILNTRCAATWKICQKWRCASVF